MNCSVLGIMSCLEAYRTPGQAAGEACPEDIVEILLVLSFTTTCLDCYRGVFRIWKDWALSRLVSLSLHDVRSRWL